MASDAVSRISDPLSVSQVFALDFQLCRVYKTTVEKEPAGWYSG
jgi:hypothetical protein